MSEIFLPKIIKICWFLFKLWLIMPGMFFSGFLFISTHISLDLLSLGSAEAYIRWGGKLNGRLMASCVINICNKNYQNVKIGFQVTVENVGDTFLGHSVYCLQLCNRYIAVSFPKWQSFYLISHYVCLSSDVTKLENIRIRRMRILNLLFVE